MPTWYNTSLFHLFTIKKFFLNIDTNVSVNNFIFVTSYGLIAKVSVDLGKTTF